MTVESRLDAAPDEVWTWVTSAGGVNQEMKPWLRFIPPPEDDLLATAKAGQILSLKIKGPWGLPLGHYPLQIKRVEEGKGFLEQTRMLPFFLWQHERIIGTDKGGTTVTDHLGWRWKLTTLDPLIRKAVRAFFKHRHRHLRSHFGQASTSN